MVQVLIQVPANKVCQDHTDHSQLYKHKMEIAPTVLQAAAARMLLPSQILWSLYITVISVTALETKINQWRKNVPNSLEN